MRSRERIGRALAAGAQMILGLAAGVPVHAQGMGHAHEHAAPTATDSAAHDPHAVHGSGHMHGSQPMPGPHHTHGSGHMAAHERMPALYGPYAVTREASGTSWQPESAPHRGWHLTRGAWSVMMHGFAFAVADRQGGTRGDDQVFATHMAMATASHPLGRGRLGLRAMSSLEPLTVGRNGYPLLLQTGETADGRTHLIDRQHPHDLFMELAATWSVPFSTRTAFVYAGLPGEPALGPPVFMHRPSAEADPESPIAHHWLDSTHITYGVITLGLVQDGFKLEASAFRGREPDQHRWNFETPKLDSYSGRLSWNPTTDWALQASAGHIKSPEQLTPAVDTDRMTGSVMWHHAFASREVSALAAWGQNRHERRAGFPGQPPDPTLDAWLIEGALEIADRHTVFARGERVEKDELFPAGDPRAEEVFTVGRLGTGYLYRVFGRGHLEADLGAMGSVALVPEPLKSVYGDTPLSASLFVRARIR
jgi:hypothetical protein